MKFDVPKRRATSSMYGFSPRFSCTTSTPGSFPVAFAGRTRYPLMLPLPSGDGTVAYSVLIRLSRSEEHTSELQSLRHLVCRLLLEKKKNNIIDILSTETHRRRTQQHTSRVSF